MNKRNGLTLVAVLAMTSTLRCGLNVVPLGQSLGPERIFQITQNVLTSFMASRSRLEAPIRVENSFWREVRPRIADTLGPREMPDRFLQSGFRTFLEHFTEFVESPRHRGEIVFRRDEVIAYFRMPHINRCAGSPCSVPPCCGNGIKCWECLPAPPTISERPNSP